MSKTDRRVVSRGNKKALGVHKAVARGERKNGHQRFAHRSIVVDEEESVGRQNRDHIGSPAQSEKYRYSNSLSI
jgi:hypothetical protein